MEEGQEPKDAGSLKKQEKVRKWVRLWSLQREPALTTPDFKETTLTSDLHNCKRINVCCLKLLKVCVLFCFEQQQEEIQTPQQDKEKYHSGTSITPHH